MIAIDTNIVVRFLTHDDEAQFKKALKIFKTEDIFIPDSVILETEWVLRYAYDYKAGEICEAFTKLFGLANVHLLNPHLVSQAIGWHLQGLDFTDSLHLANSQQYTRFLTFDRKFINKAKGLCQCTVKKP